MKFAKKAAVSLLGIICASTFAAGVAGCKPKKNPIGVPEHITTVRYALPNDGSTPAAHTGLENIGYMATVLDNQPSYHAYAHNSTKSTGYEQITQTWKDYKGKALSGYESGVMVCSDLSYSSLIKSGMQTCFVNNEAYTRSSSKPGKNTTPETAEWNTSVPTKYTKQDYITSYGEFSTELSVYVINEDTVDGFEPVTVNEDGTYTQKFYLKENSACYYQNKMKTNGNLKGYPGFESIDITFTFDGNWQVLSSYCEEKAKISPKALGGMSMKSTSKTTTEFSYGGEGFGEVNYGYFDSYFKDYVGKDIAPGDGPQNKDEPEILDVLAGGFSKVMNGGQQFSVELTLGDTLYNGKIFAKLGNMNDVLNSLEIRAALGKADSGRQDLYAEFKNGTINLYYSDSFAMTANLDAVKTVAGQFSEWIKRFDNPDKAPEGEGEGEGSGGSSSIDLNELLGALKYTVNDSSANISLKTDNLLGTGIGADVGIDFTRTATAEGDVFAFKSAKLGGITYSADSVKLSASLAPDNSEIISRDPSSTAANLADYISGVYNMLDSNTLKVDVNFDGGKQGVIPALDGINLSAQAYVALGNEIATKADLFAEYMGMSLKLTAFYDVNIHGGDYGEVYLNLTEFNGCPLDAKLYSNIKDTVTAVEGLLSVIKNSASPADYAELQSEEGVNKLVKIVNGVLSLDFGKVIGDLYASNSEIRVSVDVDQIVGVLGLDLNGLKFGTAALKLNINSDERAALSLNLAALGLDMHVCGADDTLTEPDKNEYLDATELVNLVTVAAEEAKKIISAQDVNFVIDATVTIDNVPMSVKGKGEVIWKDGKTRVALDLVLSVSDGTSAAKDSVALKLVYDETVTADDKPFVKFAFNNLAMEICRKDIAQVKDGINLIKKNIDLLINGEKTGNAKPEDAVASFAQTNAKGVTDEIQNILTNESVQKILSSVLGFANGLDVSLGSVGVNDGKINSLIINHATAGKVTLSANGNLAIDIDTSFAEASATVAAGNGSTVNAVLDSIENCELFNSENAGGVFAKAVYNYLFAIVEDASLENVLGDGTYTVTAVLNGNASAIPALSGINVNANLYYTQGLEGTRVTKDKLAELDVELDIKGTNVKANARYSGQNIYISLDKIGNTVYHGIKFTAHRDDVYGAADQLVKIITDENIIKTFSKLLHPENNSAAVYAAVEMNENTKSAVTDVIAKLLSLDFKKAFEFKKIDGVNTAKVEIDYVLSALGIDAPKLGTVTAGVNPKTHEINAELSLEGNVWASLNAKVAARREYKQGWQKDYIDVGFLNTLVKDLHNTLTDNVTGEMHSLFTFSGNANIHVYINLKEFISFMNIPINVNVPLNIVTLTAGFDERGEFYLSIVADIEKDVTAVGFTIAQKNKIAINYSKGYITFAKDLHTGSPKYKVMTLNYLLDTIFAKQENGIDSPLRWMIGMSDTIWNIVAGQINIDSGISKPQTYEMYSSLAQASKGEGNFYLSSLLSGLAVNVNGNSVSQYGTNTAAAEALGLTDNYYAADINVRSLTNGLLGTLYAALLRSDEQGIYGLCASAAMAPSKNINVDFNVNLNKYLEGVTTENGAAPNYFDIANGSVEGGIDFDREFTGSDPNVKPEFGCYNSENNSYEVSNVLARRMLSVVDGYGNVLHQIDLAHGSTVKLMNEFSPNWSDDSHTQIIYYTDENGADLGEEMILNADTNIKIAMRAATEVIFDIGIDGIVISGAVTGDLHEYPLGGYSFLGWYNDKDFKDRANNINDITNFVNGVRTVYGLFVKTQVTVNGVVYGINTQTLEYAVTGYDKEGIKPYTVSGSTLVLESSIGGYPVTAISASAFKGLSYSAEDGGVGAGLKNVIAPETITNIGAQAFMDNYGMESAIFFADTVYFGGTTVSGDSDRYVFFGCSSANGGTSTWLKLYCNKITSADSNNWHCFRNEGGYRYIGSNGGNIYGEGVWSVVEYTQTGADLTKGLDCLTSGIKDNAQTADEIRNAVLAELNGRTAKDYVNAYDVTVSGGYEPDGKLHRITVNITEKTPDEFMYRLTVETNGECKAEFTVAEESSVVFINVTYVAAGAKVALNATADSENVYTFDSWEGADSIANPSAMQTEFVMPASSTQISAHWHANYAENTYVYSAVDFVYNGKSYAAGEKVKLTNATVDKPLAKATTANGEYLLLGWALRTDDGAALEFTDDTVVDKTRDITYYAIWVVARDKIDAQSINNVSGNIPQISVTGGSVYGWYQAEDKNYTGNTVDAISTANTVLRARFKYTLTVNTEVIGSTTSKEITVDGKNQTSCRVDVVEGSKIYVFDADAALGYDPNKVFTIYIEAETDYAIVGEIRIKAKTGVFAKLETKELRVSCSNPAWATNNDRITVNEDVTFTFSYIRN